MRPSTAPAIPFDDRRRDRSAAWLLVAPAAIAVPLLLHHPVVRVHDPSPAAIAAGLAPIAVPNAIFHGVVLAILGVQALGLFAFAERLGLSRTIVRAGVVAGAVAGILLVLAGVCDGFVTPLLRARCDGGPACGDALATALSFEMAAIQASTKVGLASLSLALVAWSIAWGRNVPRQSAAVAVAVVVAAIPLVLLADGGTIGPVRLAQLFGPVCVWSLAAGIALWSGSAAPR